MLKLDTIPKYTEEEMPLVKLQSKNTLSLKSQVKHDRKIWNKNDFYCASVLKQGPNM